jgi:hypothetical protein
MMIRLLCFAIAFLLVAACHKNEMEADRRVVQMVASQPTDASQPKAASQPWFFNIPGLTDFFPDFAKIIKKANPNPEVRPPNGYKDLKPPYHVGVPAGLNGQWADSCNRATFFYWDGCPGDGPNGAFTARCNSTESYGPQTSEICWKQCPNHSLRVDKGQLMCG